MSPTWFKFSIGVAMFVQSVIMWRRGEFSARRDNHVTRASNPVVFWTTVGGGMAIGLLIAVVSAIALILQV